MSIYCKYLQLIVAEKTDISAKKTALLTNKPFGIDFLMGKSWKMSWSFRNRADIIRLCNLV
jgi:hypothetical protein